jgi:hypothetical protein
MWNTGPPTPCRSLWRMRAHCCAFQIEQSSSSFCENLSFGYLIPYKEMWSYAFWTTPNLWQKHLPQNSKYLDTRCMSDQFHAPAAFPYRGKSRWHALDNSCGLYLTDVDAMVKSTKSFHFWDSNLGQQTVACHLTVCAIPVGTYFPRSILV